MAQRSDNRVRPIRFATQTNSTHSSSSTISNEVEDKVSSIEVVTREESFGSISTISSTTVEDGGRVSFNSMSTKGKSENKVHPIIVSATTISNEYVEGRYYCF